MLNKIKENIEKFFNFSKKTINNIENSKIPFYYYLIVFLFIIQLRNLLEDFSANTGISLASNIHFTLYYIFVMLLILLLIKIITKTDSSKTFKVFSLFFSFILLGPIIDILFKGLRESPMAYFFFENFRDILIKFITFFGSNEIIKPTFMGPSLGMRVHLFIIIALISLYSYIKTNNNPKKGLLSAFLSYICIFLSFCTNEIRNLFIVEPRDQFVVIFPFFILSLIIFFVLFYLHKKEFFKTILKDIRGFRLIYYLMMFFLGIAISYNQFNTFPKHIYFLVIILSICITLSWIFSVITNNFTDYNIDKISNKERPLFKKDLSIKEYKTFGVLCLVLSIIGASLTGYFGILFTLLFILNYFVYSMPPLRFKRVPILSKLTISLNSLFLVLLGYSLFLEKERITYLSSFPTEYLIFFLIFTFAANFIDLKDYEGDKKEGIKTLPVLLGLKKSKRLIAFFFALPYLLVGYLNPFLLIPCMIYIILNSLIITEKNYDEKKLFLVFLSSILIFIIFIFLSIV